jgi:hypothetical protein
MRRTPGRADAADRARTRQVRSRCPAAPGSARGPTHQQEPQPRWSCEGEPCWVLRRCGVGTTLLDPSVDGLCGLGSTDCRDQLWSNYFGTPRAGSFGGGASGADGSSLPNGLTVFTLPGRQPPRVVKGAKWRFNRHKRARVYRFEPWSLLHAEAGTSHRDSLGWRRPSAAASQTCGVAHLRDCRLNLCIEHHLRYCCVVHPPNGPGIRCSRPKNAADGKCNEQSAKSVPAGKAVPWCVV